MLKGGIHDVLRKVRFTISSALLPKKHKHAYYRQEVDIVASFADSA